MIKFGLVFKISSVCLIVAEAETGIGDCVRSIWCRPQRLLGLEIDRKTDWWGIEAHRQEKYLTEIELL